MTTPQELTPKQHNALAFIHSYTQEESKPPSFEEIMDGLGLNSKSGVARYVQLLKKQGLLNHENKLARSMTLTDEGLAALGLPTGLAQDLNPFVHFPIKGNIVAGEPVDPGDDATDNEFDTIAVDPGRLPRRRDTVFALRVHGDSMIDSLISHGDIVLLQGVKENREVRNGDMVAAWLPHKHETTLKHFYREGDMTRLQPANPAFQPITLPADDVVVQGVVILVQRQF